MTPENFVYWLQGSLELSGNASLNKKQVEAIKHRLDLVLIGLQSPSSYVPYPITGRGQTSGEFVQDSTVIC